MGKTAARKSTTSVDNDPALDYMASLEAKQRFLGTALNMGWRLAIGFVIPVLIGAWLDKRYNSSPSYVIAGIFVGVFLGIMVVVGTVKEVNAETAEMTTKDSKKRKKRSKN